MKLVSGLHFHEGKAVQSGDILELYQYEKGFWSGCINENGRRGKGETTDEQKERNRELTLYRARKNLRRLVNANYGRWGGCDKFVTLTFRHNMTDIKKANYEFNKFIKRLNYTIFGGKKNQLKYTAVVEFQERGAIHYHVIFYNLPYIEANTLADVWGQGFIKINKIDHVDNVGAYICKYLTKEHDDERLRGEKCYFNSRGLHKPVECYLDGEGIEKIKKTLPEEAVTYQNEFENEYLGVISYIQYNLAKVPKTIER